MNETYKKILVSYVTKVLQETGLESTQVIISTEGKEIVSDLAASKDFVAVYSPVSSYGSKTAYVVVKFLKLAPPC